jgi:Na+/H+ antiporter NhaD/arsenite permease-like protein
MTANLPHLLFGLSPTWLSVLVLALTYAAVVAGRFNRAIVALFGAVLVIVLGALDQAEAIRGIDWDTIGLLVGMMIVVAVSRRSGLFQFLAVWSAQRVKANPAAILFMLQVVTALLSAVLNNVSTVLLIVPVTLVITEELEVPPFPFLFAEIFAANIGGTSTLIGDAPNILIGSQAGLDFNDFLKNIAPVTVLIMALQAATVHLVWGRFLRASPEARVFMMGMNARGMIEDAGLLIRSAVVLIAVLAAFVCAGPLHLKPATIALSGAAMLMLLDNLRRPGLGKDNVPATLAEIDWTTIFFFVGLFVVVHAVELSGALAIVADRLVAVTRGNGAAAASTILWASALLSAVLDNIPFVATMIPLIKNASAAFGGPEAITPLWWSLSLGACLGGNGTLIGASPNLAVAGIAERNGVHFGFVRYFVYAMPMTLVSIVICQLYLWLRYF